MDIELLRFTVEEELEMLLRLALAALVGGMIGYERRHSGAPAGIRTLSLVSLGAGAFTIISIFGFGDGEAGQVRDPARVAAQVATGVGFIGAGVMMRFGSAVRGLTTATGIWVSAALGMAAGAGMYMLAIGGAVIAMAILAFFPRRPGAGTSRDDDNGQRPQ